MNTKCSKIWPSNAVRVTLATLGLLVAMAPGISRAACRISSLEMPVTMVGSRAVATLRINGTDVPMIVDSGAFYSSLTHAAARQLNLEIGPLPWGMTIKGITGEMEAGVATVKRLGLLGGELPNIEFIVGGNDDHNGTMGLIGRNILAFFDVEYDLAHGVVRLMFPNDECGDKGMAYWAGDTIVSEVQLLRDERSKKTPAIEALAELNGKKMRVLFDTGAHSLVSLRAAKRASVTDLTPSGKTYGVGRGEADSWTGTVQRFELGGEAISNIRLSVVDFDLNDIDMLIGVDFFLSHRIYVSKKQRRMYFTYNGGMVFALSAIENAKLQAAQPPEPGSAASAAASETAADLPDAAAYARRGAASAARLNFARALADLERACAMAPQVADYAYRRALVHSQMQQWSSARKDFDTTLQLDPTHVDARLRRAMLRGKEDRQGALDDLQVLDKSLAREASQRLQMAQLYSRLDQTELALTQWGFWIAVNPHDVALGEALNNRCWARTMLNIDLEPALDDCDKAIDLHPKSGSYYDSRAWLRLRRGELRKALADYDRALKLKPDSAWSLYGRGIVRRKLGDTATGQTDIDAARTLDPTIDEQTGRRGLAADPKALPNG